MDWHAKDRSMEPVCRTLAETASRKFQRRWLIDHCSRRCVGREIVVDGNAKVRTKLCANADAEVWNCGPLHSHCLTGYQHPLVPGSKYCSLRQRDAEPIFESMYSNFCSISAYTAACSRCLATFATAARPLRTFAVNRIVQCSLLSIMRKVLTRYLYAA